MKGKDFKDYWEVDAGCSYIPYSRLTVMSDLDAMEEGGMIDEESVPEWLRGKATGGQIGALDSWRGGRRGANCDARWLVGGSGSSFCLCLTDNVNYHLSYHDAAVSVAMRRSRVACPSATPSAVSITRPCHVRPRSDPAVAVQLTRLSGVTGRYQQLHQMDQLPMSSVPIPPELQQPQQAPPPPQQQPPPLGPGAPYGALPPTSLPLQPPLGAVSQNEPPPTSQQPPPLLPSGPRE